MAKKVAQVYSYGRSGERRKETLAHIRKLYNNHLNKSISFDERESERMAVHTYMYTYSTVGHHLSYVLVKFVIL